MSSYKERFANMGSSIKSGAQSVGSNIKSGAQSVKSSASKGATNVTRRRTRSNLTAKKIKTLENIVKRLDSDQFRKLTRSMIRLAGANPDLPEWDWAEPWPSAELQQKQSISQMISEEMNWPKPCSEPCDGTALTEFEVRIKNDGTPRGAKIAELMKDSKVKPCVMECVEIAEDGNCNKLDGTPGCGDWNSALKGAKIMKSDSVEEVGGVDVDPEEATTKAKETQDSSLGDERTNPLIQESSGKGITPGSTPDETADTSKDLFSQINSGEIKTAPAGGRRTRRHKKHSKTKRARKHRKGGKSRVKR